LASGGAARAGSARRRAGTAAAAALLALGTAGCGGAPAPDSAPTATSAPHPTAPIAGDLSSFGHLPPVPARGGATVRCEYAGGGATARAMMLPKTADVEAMGAASVVLHTSQGDIPLALNRNESPCTVNSFLSLAAQHFFDKTRCHRLSTAALRLLQCGDPTGTGRGGPGYTFPNEYPTTTYASDNTAVELPVVYPRGTVAMANDGTPGTNGSQFFLMYADSPLPPLFTIFGTVSDRGLEVLDAVAAGGQDHTLGEAGGRPLRPVLIAATS
jgi:peptidylprolyl isomerase/peptidyl-prolyl cis-trans isomerase B (cyclophilin B)